MFGQKIKIDGMNEKWKGYKILKCKRITVVCSLGKLSLKIYPLLLVLFSFASALISFLFTSVNKRN